MPGDAGRGREARLVLDKPSDTQMAFLLDKHKYLAFGGARGGGKSWAVRAQAILYALSCPGIRIMIVRRSYPELRENHIVPMRRLVPRQIGRYNDQAKEMRFFNGSVILFRYCAREADLDNFQGLEMDVIYIDEATQMDEAVFKFLAACLRGVNDFPKRIVCTCNPGGRGHGWVKRLWVDRDFRAGERPEDYFFVRSRVTDNLALLAADPDYVRQLEALPERKRRAWLEGDWNVLEGQYFAEFEDDPAGYLTHRFSHVIKPFEPPADWRVVRSYDHGYAKPYSLAWWTVSPDGILYRILEMYGCTGTPNEGVRQESERIFAQAAKMEKTHPYLKGRSITGVADPAIFGTQTGVSVADIAARHGIYFQPGNNDRIQGWNQVHNRLAFDENGRAGLYVFENCAAFRRTIPEMIHSTTRPEDLDTSQEDHVADEVRYMCMLNPFAAPRASVRTRTRDDPLNMLEDERIPVYDLGGGY